MAAGLACAATALVASGPEARAPAAPPSPRRSAVAGTAEPTVTAPVRIADGATVALLRPGDRVDVVVATGGPGSGPDAGRARVLARGARVAGIPEPSPSDTAGGPGTVGAAENGALVVLSVPRPTAARLAAAGAAERLAVTVW